MAGAKFFHVEAFTLFSCKQALSAGFSNITGAKIARRPSKKNDEIGIKVPKNKKKIIERVFVGRRQVGGSSSQLTITSYCTDGQLQKKKKQPSFAIAHAVITYGSRKVLKIIF